MGTDDLGRDVLTEFIYGARTTLLVGVLAALFSTLMGIVIGSASGYFGGRIDSLLMRITDFFLVVPRFFLALLMAALFGPTMWNIVLVIGLLSWPGAARLVRAEFLSLKEREFVQAAKAVGASAQMIILAEILPNALPPAIVNGSLDVGKAILLEAGLSFLGMGDRENPTWGLMLNNAQRFLSAWWMALFPGLGIFLTVLAADRIGEGINDALNPKQTEWRRGGVYAGKERPPRDQ